TSPRLPPSASSFFFQHTSPTETYTLSLHDALPIWRHTALLRRVAGFTGAADPGYEHRPGDVLQRRLAPLSPSLSHRPLRRWPRRSEEHTSELQSRVDLVCRLLLEKKKQTREDQHLY